MYQCWYLATVEWRVRLTNYCELDDDANLEPDLKFWPVTT